VSASGSGGDRFGFTGREHDAALNLYYYRARFYDPATGRFVSKDPLGYDAGDANLYRYVGNGPLNWTGRKGNIRMPFFFCFPRSEAWIRTIEAMLSRIPSLLESNNTPWAKSVSWLRSSSTFERGVR